MKRIIGRRRRVGAGLADKYGGAAQYGGAYYGGVPSRQIYEAEYDLAPYPAGPDPYDGHGVVVDPSPGYPAENMLGFEALAVAAAGSVDITQQPQVDFRADRFKVASSTAPDFTIDDIKIGTRTLFAATGSVPAEVFTQDSVNALISAFTATTSMQITITVTNITAAVSDFRAVLLGRALVG